MSMSEGDARRAQFVAVPVAGGQLCPHFGHCEQFVVFEVSVGRGEGRTSEIVGTRHLDPPAHEPGLLPRWLREQGVDLVIAGGMGQRARNIFADSGVAVIVGVEGGNPEDVVRDYLDEKLQSGQNPCDH
jgi:ATP-binding protein involved in chromosome partitioning